jgi:hypothetical protein
LFEETLIYVAVRTRATHIHVVDVHSALGRMASHHRVFAWFTALHWSSKGIGAILAAHFFFTAHLVNTFTVLVHLHLLDLLVLLGIEVLNVRIEFLSHDLQFITLSSELGTDHRRVLKSDLAIRCDLRRHLEHSRDDRSEVAGVIFEL